MGLFLTGWAGDGAASPVGRINNTLLVTITTTDLTILNGPDLNRTTPMGNGSSYYPAWAVCCLASQFGPFQVPARDAVVISAKLLPLQITSNARGPVFGGFTQLYMLTVAQVIVQTDEGVNIHGSWQDGLNLFSVLMPSPDAEGDGLASTIATAIIDSNVTTLTVA
jgi:hypothetical protein